MALFENYTEEVRQLRQKLEAEYQKREAHLKSVLKERLLTAHKTFALNALSSERKLAQKYLSSPTAGK